MASSRQSLHVSGDWCTCTHTSLKTRQLSFCGWGCVLCLLIPPPPHPVRGVPLSAFLRALPRLSYFEGQRGDRSLGESEDMMYHVVWSQINFYFWASVSHWQGEQLNSQVSSTLDILIQTRQGCVLGQEAWCTYTTWEPLAGGWVADWLAMPAGLLRRPLLWKAALVTLLQRFLLALFLVQTEFKILILMFISPEQAGEREHCILWETSLSHLIDW